MRYTEEQFEKSISMAIKFLEGKVELGSYHIPGMNTTTVIMNAESIRRLVKGLPHRHSLGVKFTTIALKLINERYGTYGVEKALSVIKDNIAYRKGKLSGLKKLVKLYERKLTNE